MATITSNLLPPYLHLPREIRQRILFHIIGSHHTDPNNLRILVNFYRPTLRSVCIIFNEDMHYVCDQWALEIKKLQIKRLIGMGRGLQMQIDNARPRRWMWVPGGAWVP